MTQSNPKDQELRTEIANIVTGKLSPLGKIEALDRLFQSHRPHPTQAVSEAEIEEQILDIFQLFPGELEDGVVSELTVKRLKKLKALLSQPKQDTAALEREVDTLMANWENETPSKQQMKLDIKLAFMALLGRGE